MRTYYALYCADRPGTGGSGLTLVRACVTRKQREQEINCDPNHVEAISRRRAIHETSTAGVAIYTDYHYRENDPHRYQPPWKKH